MPIGQHILIVEDDPLVADTLLMTLEEEYHVSCVGTVGEALAFLRTANVNAVLVDSVLPDGRGCQIAEFAETSGAAVIEMSGYPAEMTGMANSRHRHLYKPFGRALLISAISEALANVRR